MLYIEKNQKEVVKYNCTLDIEKIKEIREELINNYSNVIRIRNLKCLSNKDDIENDRIKNYVNNGIEINFDYYIYPELVVYIDMLLNGNISVLKDVIEYKQKKFSIKNLGDSNLRNVICNNISQSLSIDFTPNDLLYYIKNQNNFISNNLNQSDLKYELIKSISFNKIASVNLNEFYQMINFLNLDSKDVLNNEAGVVKKRKKCN